MSNTDKIYKLYLSLLQKCGSPEKYWPQWCKKEKTSRDREVIAIGAILTQRTSWRNAELALENLKKTNLLSIKKITELQSFDPLVPLVRVAGFYKTKPRRVWEFCKFIEGFEGVEGFREYTKKDLHGAREKLLNLYGIGPETADTILLYALDEPSFIIDEYTRRLVKKEGLSIDLNYNNLKNLFEKNLPVDVGIYQNFHSLIIFSQKEKSGWGMRVM